MPASDNLLFSGASLLHRETGASVLLRRTDTPLSSRLPPQLCLDSQTHSAAGLPKNRKYPKITQAAGHPRGLHCFPIYTRLTMFRSRKFSQIHTDFRSILLKCVSPAFLSSYRVFLKRGVPEYVPERHFFCPTAIFASAFPRHGCRCQPNLRPEPFRRNALTGS